MIRNTRRLFQALWLTLGLVVMTGPSAFAQKIDFDSPPFWMPSYDEYLDWQTEQKRYYEREFTTLAQKFENLKSLREQKVLEAGESEETWQYLMRKVYKECLGDNAKANQKLCAAIADVRIKALELNAAGKSVEAQQAQDEELKALESKKRAKVPATKKTK